MTFSEIERALADTPRHTGPIQGGWIYDLINTVDSSLPVCEVGTYGGYLTAVMALAGRRVYQVDHMIGGYCEYPPGTKCLYVEVIDRMIRHGIWHKIIPMPMDSLAALRMFRVLKPSFGLVYLDGDHSRDCVFMELQQFDEFIPAGGILCGDDCTLRDNVSVYHPELTFNSCWNTASVGQFHYEHPNALGVPASVWNFFYDNHNYEPLPNVIGNGFGFRKVK